MTIDVAVYDANVLFSGSLRDLLMNLAIVQAVSAHWSDDIHEEWIHSVLQHRPNVRREALERTRRAMDEAVDGGLVKGYDALIPTLTLPDPKDRHVLAAAIHAGASWIVTFNLSDFPATALSHHGIRAISPDEFIFHLFTTRQDLALFAVKRHRESLSRPAKTVDEYLATLEKQKLPKTVAFLQDYRDKI